MGIRTYGSRGLGDPVGRRRLLAVVVALCYQVTDTTGHARDVSFLPYLTSSQ